MTDPRTVGTVFWHGISYPDWISVPLVNRSTTTEVEPPFRHGRCVIVRLPLTRRALVVGRWEGRYTDPSAAYSRALGLRVIDDNGAGWEEELV